MRKNRESESPLDLVTGSVDYCMGSLPLMLRCGWPVSYLFIVPFIINKKSGNKREQREHVEVR
jgi:hypothetical protein